MISCWAHGLSLIGWFMARPIRLQGRWWWTIGTQFSDKPMLSWFWSMFRWLAFKTVWFHCYHLHLQVMLHRSQGRGLSSFGIRHVKPYIWSWTLTSYLPVIYRWVSKVSHSFPLKHIKTTILQCCFYSIYMYNIHIHLQMNCPKKTPFLAPAIHGILHGHVWQTPQPRSEWRPQSAATQVSSTRFLADQRGAFHLQGDWGWLKWIQHDSTNDWLVVWNFFIIFHNIWDNPSHWLSYFQKGRSTARWNPSGFDAESAQLPRSEAFEAVRPIASWDSALGGIVFFIRKKYQRLKWNKLCSVLRVQKKSKSER